MINVAVTVPMIVTRTPTTHGWFMTAPARDRAADGNCSATSGATTRGGVSALDRAAEDLAEYTRILDTDKLKVEATAQNSSGLGPRDEPSRSWSGDVV